METTYGKLCEDYEGEVRRLFNFLALTPIAVKTPTLKMQTRDPKRLVTNYRELCDRFRGSIFQQYGFDG